MGVDPRQYLERHAERFSGVALDRLSACGPWAHAIVVPVRREDERCLTVARTPSVLCVLVVNAGDDADDRSAGSQLLASLDERGVIWREQDLSLHRVDGLDVLAVDRCRAARVFGPRDGVGLARKIGADLVLALHARGAVRSPWIHTSDADATLPAEHFDRVLALDDDDDVVAAVAPFEHVEDGDDEVFAATLRYELSLRYYVAGLRHAGSVHAFHTIGSLISVRAGAYAAVRGFPRRQAGEDFYLLGKLAKLGRVHSLAGAPVRLRARRSTRVPFGTGPAVEGLLGGRAFEVYDPRVFDVLARALAGLHAFAGGDVTPLEQLAAEHDDIAELHAWLDTARMLAQRYPTVQLERRIHEHVDNLRTLKLIHALTAARWPKRAWTEAVAAAAFVDVDPEAPLEHQRRWMARRER